MSRRDFGLHKVGKLWHCEFRVGEIYVHRSTKRKVYEEARQVAEKWHKEALDKSQGRVVDQEDTVAEMFQKWKDSASTISEAHKSRVEQDWRLHILPTWGSRQARTITTADAEALRKIYLDNPSLGTKPRSVAGSNKVLLHAHLVWSWAVEEAGLLVRVPWNVKVVETQEKPKDTLSKEQVRPFLAIVDTARNPHVRVAIRMMLYLALREHEALVARWEWFTPDLSTFQHGDRKAKDAPRFPVPVDLQAALRALVKPPKGEDWERPESGLLLPRQDTEEEAKRWGQYTTKTVARAGKALGLRLTPHSLRHSWATMTARQTGNAHLIKDGLGHKTLNTATKYVKLSTRDLAQSNADVFGDLAVGSQKPRNFILKLRRKLKQITN